MKSSFLLFISCFLLLNNSPASDQEMREKIQFFIENKSETDRYIIDGERLYSSQLLPRFYQNRFFNSAWSGENGLTSNARMLIRFINTIDEHGLQPADYHQALITKYVELIALDSAQVVENLFKIDILLTDAFLVIASHLYFGKVDPEKNDANWKIQRKEPELLIDHRLENAVSQTSVDYELNLLLPAYRSYNLLKQELVFYRSIEDDQWPKVGHVKALKPGEEDNIVPKVRQRLLSLKYDISDSLSKVYDAELESVMKQFQSRHGLNNDGVIGKLTIEALNITPRERVEMIRVNMERIRWLPLTVPDSLILVNIADYTLDVLRGKDTLLTMRSIVGKSYRKTPAFVSKMTYLVFSPTWVIPQGILTKDVIPAVQKDPDYLAKKNMKVLRFDGTEVDPATVEWSKYKKRGFPYMIRQEPGADNALGWVKFMFPNTYDVYIHDTPNRNLFSRDERTFSSGCIRIEKPLELAKLLLSDNPKWDDASISKAMYSGKEQTVRLLTPWTVAIVYLTAWVDEQNKIQFRKDVYERDKIISQALKQKSAYSK